MRKRVYFDVFEGPWWPSPAQLEPFFLAPKGHEWSFRGGNDSWDLAAEGLYDTDHLSPMEGSVNVRLFMVGNPRHGVLLGYSRWDGRVRHKQDYSSCQDLSRLDERVKDLHGSVFPVGLFIPFATAWKAVKEFLETDGELPRSIEWIDVGDLPEDAFLP
jgi:hypothetical protein